MKPQYSQWAPVIVLAQIAGLIIYEFIALRSDKDEWPTITSLTMGAIHAKWWVAIFVLGSLIWLTIHFARRI